jgi:hypothetical protein
MPCCWHFIFRCLYFGLNTLNHYLVYIGSIGYHFYIARVCVCSDHDHCFILGYYFFAILYCCYFFIVLIHQFLACNLYYYSSDFFLCFIVNHYWDPDDLFQDFNDIFARCYNFGGIIFYDPFFCCSVLLDQFIIGCSSNYFRSFLLYYNFCSPDICLCEHFRSCDHTLVYRFTEHTHHYLS